MTYPIPGVGISTPYGKRGSYWSCDEDANGNGIHTGVDFACASGTDILAPIRGQIRHRSYGSAFGNHQFAISPDPGQPFGDGEVFFAHTIDRPKDGVWVEVGDYIASVGAEGNVSGPHLHMEYHAVTKGTWSCSVIDDPQPVLDYQPTPVVPDTPKNPNNVKVGEKVVVTADGSLNGRSGPGSDYPVVTSKAEGATFVVKALVNGWAGDTEQPANAPLIAGEEVVPTGPGVPVYDTDYLYGIDISSNNDDSWKQDPNWQYAFIKGTEGTSYVNEKGEDQRDYVRDRTGWADHYFWINGGHTGAEQAEFFASQVDVLPGEMIAVDWEESGTSNKVKDDAINRIRELFPDANVGGLYCNENYWYNHDTTGFYGDFLWIAHPGSEPTIKTEWLFWQYDWGTDAKPLDKNYGRFADLAALRAWASKGSDYTPPEPPDPEPPAYVGNWFSTDYLDQYSEPVKPGWKSTPHKVLSMAGVPGSVSYLQGVMHVEAVDEDDGTHHDSIWIVAQDYENSGDTRFLAFREDGSFINWFQVNDGGHAQTFYAYRSAAGNLYVWVGEDPAYRHAWQPGKKVVKTSGDKMDYKGSRPQGGYKDRIVFRNATDTEETFYLFDRTDFTDGTNRSTPIKKVTLTKDTSPTQQGWWANSDRIYRLRGSTNEDTEHNHDGLHRLDVFKWDGTCLLRDFDVTDMHRSGATENEPEGGSFINVVNATGPLCGMREGSASASKRSYVLWELTGMP